MSRSPTQSPPTPKKHRPSLRLVLIVPFLLQLFAAVGLTGWLSLRNGQKAVDEAIAQLRDELTRHTLEYLSSYLETAHRINRLNADAIRTGLLDERQPEAFARYFWHQLEEVEPVAFIFFGSPLGGSAGAGRRADGARTLDSTEVDPELGLVAGTRFEFAADLEGRRSELLEARPGFDARRRPWFQSAVTAEGPAWSGIYTLFSPRGLALAASMPVYHGDGELRGVVASDLTLTGVGDFLRQLEIGKTGEIFIVEKTGHLVATSTTEDLWRLEGEKMNRLWAVDSAEPLIGETARLLIDRLGGLHRVSESVQLTFEIGAERQFVQASPLNDGRGIDWLVVTVVPESDFMDRIRANTRNTIWLCIAALLIATALGLLTSRSIARPIVRLNDASKALARGHWGPGTSVEGVREVEELATSFNQMASELRGAFGELEARVEQRTAELLEAKEAADDANQAKSQFLANVSHELRTPLAAILGYVELLRDQELPPVADSWLRTIRSNGKHLDHLLSDLLDISRIEAGRLDLDIRPCELGELLAQLSSVFEPAAAERGLRLDIDTREWLPWIFDADPVRLRQVLSNLVSNAIKYTHQGRVTVHVECDRKPQDTAETLALAMHGPESTTLVFEVKDTGVGISAEDQKRLFQRFTRLSTSQGGFGLGLTITRQLIDLMGGEVEVQSRVGAGSCFTVRVPVRGCRDWAQEERGYEKSGHILLPALPTLRGRVLIAEDSVSLQNLCRQMLLRWGLECETAKNGREAVEKTKEASFDAILMDWQMPEMDGLEATVELRRRGITTPIVALTAAAMAGDRERCLAAGCSDYLSKPIDFKNLYQLLMRILGRVSDRGGSASSDEADDEVAALTRAYIRGLPAKVAELRGHLEAAAWCAFNAAAHKLVGTVGTYGLEEIYRAAEALEEAGSREDAEIAATRLDQLAHVVDQEVSAA